jgi:hypothetical protein
MCLLCCCAVLCADVECTDTVLPVTYPKFAGMMEPGDTLYVGRYLVSGADSASLYLEVCVLLPMGGPSCQGVQQFCQGFQQLRRGLQQKCVVNPVTQQQCVWVFWGGGGGRGSVFKGRMVAATWCLVLTVPACTLRYVHLIWGGGGQLPRGFDHSRAKCSSSWFVVCVA